MAKEFKRSSCCSFDGAVSNCGTVEPSVEEATKTYVEKAVEELKKNPYEEITIKPDYYNLDSTMRDLCIQILSGYIWEAKNTEHFMAKHPELRECEDLLHQFVWLKEKKEYWPSEDEMLQLAFVDFARLLPALWD